MSRRSTEDSQDEMAPTPDDRTVGESWYAVAGFAVLLVLVAVVTISVPFALEIGTLRSSGPGFWVLCVGVITTGLLALALLRPAIRSDSLQPLTRSQARGFARALPLLLLATPLLTTCGLAITLSITSFYWLKVVTGRTWVNSLVGAALISSGIFVIFVKMLGVPFPLGSLTGI